MGGKKILRLIGQYKIDIKTRKFRIIILQNDCQVDMNFASVCTTLHKTAT